MIFNFFNPRDDLTSKGYTVMIVIGLVIFFAFFGGVYYFITKSGGY